MKKYKVVRKVNEFDAIAEYYVKKRFCLFFWTYFGKD